ncbi:hypothetical protein BDZ91DRAFT_809209 [Kalaharituber pfeilii]|nr:hypothetical protein BDZ91DRAFT_809209 [Kalaharituber pfeilii]
MHSATAQVFSPKGPKNQPIWLPLSTLASLRSSWILPGGSNLVRCPYAIVLTDAESRIPLCSGLGSCQLDEKLCLFWGDILDNIKAMNPKFQGQYQRWMEYFLRHDHPFGTVYAWVGSLVRFQGCSIKDLDHPLYDPDSYDIHCELRPGIVAEDDMPWKIIYNELGHGAMDLSEFKSQCPRRVWDVAANAVIPWSWGYIKIPRGTTLEDIRRDLIKHNVRYAWLDVICLRQEANPRLARKFWDEDTVELRERRRLEEWKVDVPMIGAVYRGAEEVVTYFSGLGRKLQSRMEEWESDNSWFRRAWTLQEAKPQQRTLLGGINSSVIERKEKNVRRYEGQYTCATGKELQCQEDQDEGGNNAWEFPINSAGLTLGAKLALLTNGKNGEIPMPLELFSEMSNRSASNPLDRIAGLAFLLTDYDPRTRIVPVYKAEESLEVAWIRLIMIYNIYRAENFHRSHIYEAWLPEALLRHFSVRIGQVYRGCQLHFVPGDLQQKDATQHLAHYMLTRPGHVFEAMMHEPAIRLDLVPASPVVPLDSKRSEVSPWEEQEWGTVSVQGRRAKGRAGNQKESYRLYKVTSLLWTPSGQGEDTGANEDDNNGAKWEDVRLPFEVVEIDALNSMGVEVVLVLRVEATQGFTPLKEAFKSHLKGKDKSTQNPGPSPGPTKLPSSPKKPTTKKPATPDASTPVQGIVVHGIALRKDLGKVRKWLESGNKIGKTVGIRWLRSKTRLVEEGKKTSSVVLYLEKMIEVEKVRLGGRWLRVDQYEWDRGRK